MRTTEKERTAWSIESSKS